MCPLFYHVSCIDFWWNIKSPRGLSPLQPRFGALQLLAFPKTKMIFEREEISDRRWDSGKYHGAAHGDWETCVRSQGAYIEGDWGIIVLCTIFLVSCIILNKCLYFSYYMVGYFLDRPHILGWNFLDWKKITYLLQVNNLFLICISKANIYIFKIWPKILKCPPYNTQNQNNSYTTWWNTWVISFLLLYIFSF